MSAIGILPFTTEREREHHLPPAAANQGHKGCPGAAQGDTSKQWQGQPKPVSLCSKPFLQSRSAMWMYTPYVGTNQSFF